MTIEERAQEQPKESWEADLRKLARCHDFIDGYFEINKLEQFISSLLQKQREEIKEWAEKHTTDSLEGDVRYDVIFEDDLIKFLNQ